MKQSTVPKPKPHVADKLVALGGNIRKARKARGIKTREMAAFLDISPTYIGLIERGERSPSFSLLVKICDFLGESSEDLLTPATKKALADAEKKPANTPSPARKAAHGMLDTFSDAELSFIVNTLKNFKAYNKGGKGLSDADKAVFDFEV